MTDTQLKAKPTYDQGRQNSTRLTLIDIANDLPRAITQESLKHFTQYAAFEAVGEPGPQKIKAVIYLDHSVTPQDLADALELIASKKRKPQQKNALTPRERDVLSLFSRGLSYKESANILGISAHTVSDHVKSIYRKLGVNSRNEAVYEAVQNGWLVL